MAWSREQSISPGGDSGHDGLASPSGLDFKLDLVLCGRNAFAHPLGPADVDLVSKMRC
jgi:hypothetical protein